ncbi:MAG TPA: hypothetical protein VEZ24_15270 [Microvirga sp.]|nr:hypothetical protein [Microvirga sp.]
MRRPHRNIEIFSMSVLDMFASALGAFIMVAVILFPYYKKDVSKELSETRTAIEQRTTELQATREQVRQVEERIRRQEQQVQQSRLAVASLNQCRQNLAQCQAESTKTFLMIQIEWAEEADVNLHVVNPQGQEFSWSRTNRAGRDVPGSKAQLSIDVAIGPGIEVWVDPDAGKGTYQIEYRLPRSPDKNIEVKGVMFDRSGKKALPVRILRSGETRVRVAMIEIASDGTAAVR